MSKLTEIPPKPSKVLILDTSFIWAFVVYYSIAVGWGVMGAVTGTPTIFDTWPLLQPFWPIAVSVISLAIIPSLITRHELFEKWFTVGWLAVASMYPASIIYQFWAGGHEELGARSMSTLMYLVFPAIRTLFLFRKNGRPGA